MTKVIPLSPIPLLFKKALDPPVLLAYISY
jgi:hypothetical protein